MRPALFVACLATVFLFPFSTAAQTPVGLFTVAEGLNSPVFLTAPEDGSGRLFVVEQPGRIRIVSGGEVLDTPFLNLTGVVEYTGEKGLLGMAFHPDYAVNGYFYVNYTCRPAGTLLTRVSRFTVSDNPNAADAATEQIVIEFEQPYNNHNGGMLGFGPMDGYLYIGAGDGGSGNDPDNNAQNLHSMLGKILRIDVDAGTPYAVPPDNPYEDNFFAYPEIWAYGLRNPWRFSFDRGTGDLYIADVGQAQREEINYQPAFSSGGENYGWRVFEGTRCNTPTVTTTDCNGLSSATPPVYEYTHADGFAVTGGYVYRGAALPSLQGIYFYADFSTARVWSIVVSGGSAGSQEEWTARLDPDGTLLTSLASFGEDENGELYLVSLGGKLLRFDPAHAADANRDFSINLSELLRVIQFYNSGALHCEPASEDGYAPGTGNEACTPHSSDYRPADWRIDISELLRVIQFYNSGGYRYCGDSEDTFCVR